MNWFSKNAPIRAKFLVMGIVYVALMCIPFVTTVLAVNVTSAVESPSGTPYVANTWSNESVIITFTCSDAGTGIATAATPGWRISARRAC